MFFCGISGYIQWAFKLIGDISMLQSVAIVQIIVFIAFFVLERLFPARDLPRAKFFVGWWIIINSFSLAWFSWVMIYWLKLPTGPISHNLSSFQGGLVFYLLWSFFGYWWHRLRHSNKTLWHMVHKFHHSPPRMETAVAFFKHPLEYMTNTVLITFIAWFFGLSAESIVLGIAIEGLLETFHHANIKTPKPLRWIGYIIQTPEMHLVHHERGLHRYNYATFLWDTVFSTIRIPKEWEGKQGFKTGHDIKKHFLLQT